MASSPTGGSGSGTEAHSTKPGRNGPLWPKRAGQDQPDRPLPEHPGGAVTQAGLGAGVGDRGVAEPGAVEMGRLLGVADPQLDMVDAEQGEGVLWCRRGQCSTSREMVNAAQNAQKGGTRCPHRRPIYRLDAAYATELALGPGGLAIGVRGRRSSKRAPWPPRAGSQTTSSPPWALASWRAM